MKGLDKRIWVGGGFWSVFEGESGWEFEFSISLGRRERFVEGIRKLI